jgi:hypothetical protein
MSWDLLDNDRISTNLLFFKNRGINTKMEPRPLFVRTHGDEDLCDASDYYQAGTEKTLVSE